MRANHLVWGSGAIASTTASIVPVGIRVTRVSVGAVHRFLGNGQNISHIGGAQRIHINVCPSRQSLGQLVQILGQIESSQLRQYQQSQIVHDNGQLFAVLDSASQLLRFESIKDFPRPSPPTRHTDDNRTISRHVLRSDARVPSRGRLRFARHALHGVTPSSAYTLSCSA